MRFKYKLGLALLAAGIIPLTVVSKINMDELASFAQREAVQSAEAGLELKSQLISAYFDSVIDYGAVVSSMDGLANDIANLQRQSQYLLKRDEDVTPSAPLQKRYEYQQQNTPDTTNEVAQKWISGLDAQAITMQEVFIARNPNPIGQKERLDQAVVPSTYSRLHGKIHPMYRSQLEGYGFYDIFLIEPTEGRIVYSVFKEVDFGTRLINGPYAKTNFGLAAQEMIANRGAEPFVIADFDTYAPSYDAQAAFALFPVGSGDTFGGILAVQLPAELIARILTQAESKGDKNQSFLISPNGRLRSNYAFNEDLSIGNKLPGPIGEAVTATPQGTQVLTDERGELMLASWRPAGLKGLDWTIVSEINMDVVMAATNEIRDRSVKMMGFAVAGILFCGFFLTSWLLGPIRKVASFVTEEAGRALEKLSKTSGEARQASVEMASIAQETQMQIDKVSERSVTVGADVTDVAASIEELSAALESVSRSVEMTSQLTDQSVAKAGVAADASRQLQQAASDIAGVVTLIDDIAKQTKLLSINAGIEAANAGAEGRGFKVLAGEIEKLAARTSQSTSEISDQIEVVLASVSMSASAMSEIADMITQVNQQAQNISVSAHQQKEATASISTRMRRALTNVEESNGSLGVVHDASGRAASAAEQLLSGVGEVDTASKTMDAAITNLTERLRTI